MKSHYLRALDFFAFIFSSGAPLLD